jgi:methylmalonyl-CoA/ethylmalonyl-CoA epimerase
MSAIAKLAHIGISVEDISESLKWYHDVFGFELLSQKTLAHVGTKVAYIGNSDFIIELIKVVDPKPIPPERSHPDTDNSILGVKHFCVLVDNSREFVAKLKEKNVPVVFEPQTSESYVAFINDPTGNSVEIYDTTNDVSKMRSELICDANLDSTL